MNPSQPLLRQGKSTPTHVCVDCGALGIAGGYHDHGGGNAGETIRLTDLPKVIQSFQQIENERDDLRDELEDSRDCWRRAMDIAAKWQQAFNSLEKPVTNHIERCMDADDLDRAHRAVMRKYGPKESS